MSKKQELKNYVVNSVVHNAFDPNELLRLINLLPEQPQLNPNQQIVLEYLKTRFGKNSIFVKSVFVPINELLSSAWNDDVDIALEQLDLKQEIQVLEVFGQWALEQEEEK